MGEIRPLLGAGSAWVPLPVALTGPWMPHPSSCRVSGRPGRVSCDPGLWPWVRSVVPWVTFPC
eukprot:14649935-Heterocapsa_arctica.AAC.1